MRSVQRARSAVLPPLAISRRSQETAAGAALFARRLLAPAFPSSATGGPPNLRSAPELRSGS
jgi:hypothetical protein